MVQKLSSFKTLNLEWSKRNPNVVVNIKGRIDPKSKTPRRSSPRFRFLRVVVVSRLSFGLLRFLFLFSFFFFFVFTKRLPRETRTNPGLIYIYIYERVGGVQRERLFVSSLVVVKMWQKKCHLCCVEVKKAFETCALFQEEEEEGPAFPKPFLFPFFVLSPKV